MVFLCMHMHKLFYILNRTKSIQCLFLKGSNFLVLSKTKSSIYSFLFRDNARSIQPGSWSDHSCVCLPWSHGGPVLFRGPTHQGEEQAKAQETACQTANVPPAANDNDGEKPYSLSGTAALSYCWGAGFITSPETLLRGQLALSSSSSTGADLHGVW